MLAVIDGGSARYSDSHPAHVSTPDSGASAHRSCAAALPRAAKVELTPKPLMWPVAFRKTSSEARQSRAVPEGISVRQLLYLG
jgi:hypothetical protein